MKLNNLTSLDPDEQARGIRGLTRHSKLDRLIWDEFLSDRETLAAESELLWEKVVDSSETFKQKDVSIINESPGSFKTNPNSTQDTEALLTQKYRLAQRFFRRSVLSIYDNCCCISNIPVNELLIASHILPWADFPSERVNPSNGLCLSRLHDGAFDQGLITFDEDRRLVLSREIQEYLPNDSIQNNFIGFAGQPFRLPEKYNPNPDFLRFHRENIFRSR